MANAVRIYKPTGNGMFVESDFVMLNGKQVSKPANSNQVFSADQIAGFPVLGKGALPFAVQPTEDAAGNAGVMRVEQPNAQALRKIWNFTIKNTDTDPVEMVMFDNLGLVAKKLKLGALPVTTTVTGVFGTDTAAVLASITGPMPARLRRLWIKSATSLGVANTEFFDNGFVNMAYADIANQTLFDNTVPLLDTVTPQDYQQSIRIAEDLRVLITPNAALHISIPGETQVTFALTIQSVVDAYNMVLMNNILG